MLTSSGRQSTPPRTTSSSNSSSSSQKNEPLEAALRMELSGLVFRGVEGFWQRFRTQAWSPQADRIYAELENANHGDALAGLGFDEAGFFAWLSRLQVDYLSPLQTSGVYHRTESTRDLVGFQALRQIDVALVQAHAQKPFRPEQILMVMELTKTSMSKCWQDKFLQISIYVREIFIADPLRQYVFALCQAGQEFEAWVFDRAGAYSSGPLGIKANARLFVSVIVGYALMTPVQLGFPNFLNPEDRTITCFAPVNGEETSFSLALKPRSVTKAIVSRATTCYVSSDGLHMVKLAWRPISRPAEADVLQAAQNIETVPRLIASRDFASTAALREGLDFTRAERKTFSSDSRIFSRPGTRSTSSRPLSGIASLRQPSRPASAPQPARRLEDDHALYQDRILGCTVIAPVGRPLQSVSSAKELAQVLLDGIITHQALVTKARILHRDISAGNIVLVDPSTLEARVQGMLIDFDLAITMNQLNNQVRTGALHLTGTLEYMGLDFLRSLAGIDDSRIEHNARHDLESFLWLLLSVCIRDSVNFDHRQDPLTEWYLGNYRTIYLAKFYAMTDLHYTTRSFSERFAPLKPLAVKLKSILFPDPDSLLSQTTADPVSFYAPMIRVFKEAIEQCP